MQKPSSGVRITLDRALQITWATLSTGLLLYFVLGWLQLRRSAVRAQRQEVDGITVFVTERTGPAAFGLIHPVILVPRWLFDAPTSTRNLAIKHELTHIASRDAALLYCGMAVLLLMPWNPALWFIFGRLRFSIEADCDARVVKDTEDTQGYVEALLNVSEHRMHGHLGSVALSSPRSWLERRVRIMLAGTTRLNRILAASGSLWALGLLIFAVLVHAPGLAAPGELRKLPPDDTKPDTALVRAVTRARYPELFDPAFTGMARVTLILNQDGSLVRTHLHTYLSNELPRLDLSGLDAEDRDLGLEHGDILYSDVVDIAPATEDETPRAIGYIEYEVLKWPHDPKRAESIVRSAAETYYPELTKPGTPGSGICSYYVAVLMHDDGSVRQAHKAAVACGGTWDGDHEEALNDFKMPITELGRRGTIGMMTPTHQTVAVIYTWPRHADDPPNVEDLGRGRVNADTWTKHRPHQDTQDDAAIAERYFPDIEEHGHDNLFTMIDGRRYRLAPWILFGRDGRIWQTGRAPFPVQSNGTYGAGLGLTQRIESLFPGIRTGSTDPPLLVHGVAIHCFWISPDSPVQRPADMGRRKDLLVNTDFVDEARWSVPNSRLPNPIINSTAQAMNFGTSAGIGFVQYALDRSPNLMDAHVLARVISTEASSHEVNIELQIRGDLVTSVSQSRSDDWVRAALVRIPYGSSATVHLFDLDSEPPRISDIVLRPELLRDDMPRNAD